jgi:hypothetical protein
MGQFYDDDRFDVVQHMTMGKVADGALGSAFSAQTKFDVKTMLTNVTIKDWNLRCLVGATCTGTSQVATQVWTLKLGYSSAGTGALTAIGTATVGTAGQANMSVLDASVTETNLAAGDDLIFYTDAGTALGDDSLIARADISFVEHYVSS